MATDLQKEETPFALIHPVRFLSFYELRYRFITLDPSRKIAPSSFPAFAFPPRFLALAYPHLSDCNSAYTEPWNRQINPVVGK